MRLATAIDFDLSDMPSTLLESTITDMLGLSDWEPVSSVFRSLHDQLVTERVRRQAVKIGEASAPTVKLWLPQLSLDEMGGVLASLEDYAKHVEKRVEDKPEAIRAMAALLFAFLHRIEQTVALQRREQLTALRGVRN